MGPASTALQRNELLLLERYDAREKDWVIGGFVEFHMRVDDTLTLRDLGTIGDTPHAGRGEAPDRGAVLAAAPVSATAVVRRDAEAWNEILASIPASVDGPPEYRRPHYYNIWKWSPELARQAQRGGRHRGAPPRGGPGHGAAPLTVRALVRRMMPVIVARSVPASMAGTVGAHGGSVIHDADSFLQFLADEKRLAEHARGLPQRPPTV